MALLEEVKKDYGELKLFIDGEWVPSRSDRWDEDPNPATGERIASYPTATERRSGRRWRRPQRPFPPGGISPCGIGRGCSSI